MNNHNLEIWKDEDDVIHISFWDSIYGKDSHLKISEEGEVYENNALVKELDYQLFHRLLTRVEESYGE